MSALVVQVLGEAPGTSELLGAMNLILNAITTIALAYVARCYVSGRNNKH